MNRLLVRRTVNCVPKFNDDVGKNFCEESYVEESVLGNDVYLQTMLLPSGFKTAVC